MMQKILGYVPHARARFLISREAVQVASPMGIPWRAAPGEIGQKRHPESTRL